MASTRSTFLNKVGLHGLLVTGPCQRENGAGVGDGVMINGAILLQRLINALQNLMFSLELTQIQLARELTKRLLEGYQALIACVAITFLFFSAVDPMQRVSALCRLVSAIKAVEGFKLAAAVGYGLSQNLAFCLL